MKKILSMLLAFTIACTNFSGISNINPIAAEVVTANDGVATIASGDVFKADGFTYKITSNDDKKVTVTSYSGDSASVTILGSVTFATGNYDASGNLIDSSDETTAIKAIGDGETYTVTAVDGGIFGTSKTNIRTIIVNDSVETIGDSAFSGCTSLENVTLPTNTYFRAISSNLFKGCTSLVNVTIPDTIQTLGTTPFSGCTALKTITFEGNAPTSPSSGTIKTAFGVSAKVTYTSDSSTNSDWKTFITKVTADADSEYINSSAVALDPTISYSGGNSATEYVVGETLSVIPDDLVNYTIQWSSGTTSNLGTSATYTLKDSDIGTTIKATIIVKNDYTYEAETYDVSTTLSIVAAPVELKELSLSLSTKAPTVGGTLALSGYPDDLTVGVDYTIVWKDSANNELTDYKNKTSVEIGTDLIGKTITATVEITDGDDKYVVKSYDVSTETDVPKLTLPTPTIDPTAPAYGQTLAITNIPDDLTKYSTAWYLGDSTTPIDGKTEDSIEIIGDYAGSTMHAVITVADDDPIYATKTDGYKSNVTSKVAYAAVNVTIGVTDGDDSTNDDKPEEGNTLFVVVVDGDGEPIDSTNYTVDWSDGTFITENSDTFDLETRHAGSTITATVTINADSGYDNSKTYTASTTVLKDLPEITLSGTASVGQELTVTSSSNIDLTKYSINWYIVKYNEGGTVAEGPTKLANSNTPNASLTLTEAHVGYYIIVEVIDEKDNTVYNQTPQTAETTKTISAQDLPTPNITLKDEDGETVSLDTIKVGQTVTVSVEGVTDLAQDVTDGKYTIQWYKGYEASSAVPGDSSYELIAIVDGEDATYGTSPSFVLTEAEEDYYIRVSVTPTEDNTSYANKEIYSAWTTNVVANKDGKTSLSDLTIGYSDDGSSLVITSHKDENFDNTNYYNVVWYNNKSQITQDSEDTTPSTLESSHYTTGDVIYATVKPKTNNPTYKVETIKSNEFTILQGLPDLEITNDTDLKDGKIQIGSELTLSFVSGADLENLENLYIEWLVGDVVKSQGVKTASNTLETFTILEDYSGKNISVKVTNKTGTNYNEEYNSVPVEIADYGTVETKSYTFTYKLDPSLSLTSSNSHGSELEYGTELIATLALTDNSGEYALPRNASDIDITMGGSKFTNFSYNSSTGVIIISSVTGAVHIEATAYVNQPDTGLNYPTIYLDDTMTGVTSSRYTLTDADINDDGWYEFYLSADVLPETIKITFGSAVPMTLIDGYLYYDNGRVEIDPTRFGSNALGYYATISGTWANTDGSTTSPNTEPDDYQVTLNASGEGIVSITDEIKNVADGGIFTVDLTAKTNYQTPIIIKSITVAGKTLSASDYSVSGTKITLNSGIITSDCTVNISATATNAKYGSYKVSPYLGSDISLPADTVTYAIEGSTYTLTLIPTTDYALPSTITVTMVDSSGTTQTLSVGSDYSYNTTTGVIEIPSVTGDITITVGNATGTVYHSVNHKLTNVYLVSGTEPGTEIIKDGTTYTGTFAVTDDIKYYALTSDDIYVSVGGVNWTTNTNTTFDESTGKLTIANVTGDVVISIDAATVPSSHTLYFNLSYLYSDIVLETNDYKLTVDNGDSKSVILKVKSDYVGEKYLPASVTVVNSRTGDTLVAGTDYTYSISSDGYATLTLKTVTDSLKITATAGSTQADTDTDSDGGSDDNGSGDSGDSDSDSDDSTAATYDITFIDSSGNTVTTLTTSTDKTLSYLPTITTTSNTVFLGWYTSSSGGTQITTSTVFTSSRNVYARVYTVFTPVYNSNGQHEINTSNSNISIYADSLSGGTITVNSNYVANFVIISPYSGYTTTASTTINLPDSNGNTVSWTIPAGVQIDSTNHLNLAISVSETPINTSTTLGRSLGYVDFAHSGALTANNQTLYVSFRNVNVTTGDTPHLFKLNDYNEMTGDYVSATALGNYYIRAGMVSCSRWEIIARNYSYNPDNGGYYTQYFNIPTTGYIEELRNVQIDQVLDLTKINLGNGIIIEGWYYDQNFTNKVSNPSYVVVTAAIIKTGLYPKTYTDYVTPENGNPWPDSSNGYLPNLSDTPVTNTKTLIQLF